MIYTPFRDRCRQLLKDSAACLRLGYLVAPPDLLGALLAAKWVSDRHVPSLTQMALAEFMSDGSFAGFLRRMRRIYAERHALLSEGLLRIAPDLLPPSSLSPGCI
jgi:GntR family transcriptional regulator / MocR family aminotransferase